MITAGDVRWAYKYYFNRPPEDPAALAYHQNAYGDDAALLQQQFFAAPEIADQAGFATNAAEFCLWRPDALKLVVAGNCLGPNLARAAAALADISVYGVDILGLPDRQDELLAMMDAADIVVLPLLGNEFKALESGAAAARFGRKVQFYSLPFFSGVHPDIAYLGQRGARIGSPVGDYHSKTVLRAFLSEQSLAACLRGIADHGFAALAPKQVWAESEAEFRRRETHATIRIASWFFRAIRKRPLLYTLNHPNAEVLTEIMRQAIANIGLKPRLGRPDLIQSTLTGNVIWPVHRDIARQLRLRYDTSDVIYAEQYAMSFAEYAMRAYELYARAGRETVRAAAVERGLLA